MARKKKKKEVEKDIIPKKSIINRTNILFIDIQVFLTCLVIIFFIISIFNKKMIVAVEVSLIFALLCMAYNNMKIYKRKFATIMYLVVAVAILVLLILRLLGVF